MSLFPPERTVRFFLESSLPACGSYFFPVRFHFGTGVSPSPPPPLFLFKHPFSSVRMLVFSFTTVAEGLLPFWIFSFRIHGTVSLPSGSIPQMVLNFLLSGRAPQSVSFFPDPWREPRLLLLPPRFFRPFSPHTTPCKSLAVFSFFCSAAFPACRRAFIDTRPLFGQALRASRLYLTVMTPPPP